MKKKIAILLAVAGIAYALGRFTAGRHENQATTAEDQVLTEYTCSMHPQIRQPGPGQCPICAMDLIPVSGDETPTGPRSLVLSAAARALARIETATTVKGKATAEVVATGALTYRSEHTREITLFAEAQVRKVHTPLSGTRVSAGQPLADLYSPEVLSAMRELSNAGQNQLIANAARQKLRLLGIANQDVEAIKPASEVAETFSIRSPAHGIVDGIDHHPGEWLMKGMRLATVQDDAVLRAALDLYASDNSLVSTGHTLVITPRDMPGISITGVISSISAGLDEMTRTRTIFADIPNPDNRLQSGMIIRGLVRADLPGEHTMVPATAVLKTGTRAIVYVQKPDDDSQFESRVVVTGPRVGDQYVITSGLGAGEIVVTRGAIRLDSTMQLMAKPSMMSMPSDGGNTLTPTQTHCPVEGGEIERDVYVDVQGYRIYFCCPGCDTEFLASPEEYLSRMKAEGIELEKSPAPGVTSHSH